MHTPAHSDTTATADRGFTLVELLIVIVILGILATVTVFAVRGITDKGNTSACNSDKVTLQTAVESYFAQYGTKTGIATQTYVAQTGVTGTNGYPALTTAVGLPQTTPAVTWGVVVGTNPPTSPATPGATLVAAGFLRALPTNFFVDSKGGLWTINATCGGGVVGLSVG